LDIKLFFFAKKFCFPLYHLVMLFMSRWMDAFSRNTKKINEMNSSVVFNPRDYV